MISIISIGKFCSLIAEGFEKYPQYNIFTISNNKESGENHISMPVYKTAEEYETHLPNIKRLLNNLGEQVHVFVDGSEAISGITLGILQKINKPITIYYIKSDMDLLSDTEKLQDRVAFSVLQEYARSGLFSGMCIIDKTKLEQIVGDIPLTQYNETLSSVISSTVHMCNVYANTASIMNNVTDSDIVNRIFTVGFAELSSGTIKWFYELKNANELMHHYAINSETLEKDEKLLQKIKKQIKDKQIENCKIMFGVYKTSYKDNFVYCVARTKFIQQLGGA